MTWRRSRRRRSGRRCRRPGWTWSAPWPPCRREPGPCSSCTTSRGTNTRRSRSSRAWLPGPRRRSFTARGGCCGRRCGDDQPGRSMMCIQAAEQLDDYLDGTLPQDEHHRLELHLAECADCREEEQTLRAILAAADALPAGRTPSRDLWPGIRERLVLDEPLRAPLSFRAWGGSRAALVAAAAVLIAI